MERRAERDGPHPRLGVRSSGERVYCAVLVYVMNSMRIIWDTRALVESMDTRVSRIEISRVLRGVMRRAGAGVVWWCIRIMSVPEGSMRGLSWDESVVAWLYWSSSGRVERDWRCCGGCVLFACRARGGRYFEGRGCVCVIEPRMCEVMSIQCGRYRMSSLVRKCAQLKRLLRSDRCGVDLACSYMRRREREVRAGVLQSLLCGVWIAIVRWCGSAERSFGKWIIALVYD
ncbi:hypothetical protein Tco_0455174 [Tanacetum coccineum]